MNESLIQDTSGILELSLSFPGTHELPPAGNYLLQLSLPENFFAKCPFREEYCRARQHFETRGKITSADQDLLRHLMQNRIRKQWATQDLKKEAARSNLLAVIINDRRPTKPVEAKPPRELQAQ